MGRREARLSATRAARSQRGRAWILFAFLAVAAILASLTLIGARSGHRRPPRPQGLVFRVEARAVRTPFERFHIVPADHGGPAVEVRESGVDGAAATSTVYAYPSGEVRSRTVLAHWPVEPEVRALDLDGDGLQDLLEIGAGTSHGLARVLSGGDRRVLFADEDPLEYESAERLVSLGDLDGDGFSELAVIHPRMDRSRYDLELWDRLLGARSWISIVSGSRLAR